MSKRIGAILILLVFSCTFFSSQAIALTDSPDRSVIAKETVLYNKALQATLSSYFDTRQSIVDKEIQPFVLESSLTKSAAEKSAVLAYENKRYAVPNEMAKEKVSINEIDSTYTVTNVADISPSQEGYFDRDSQYYSIEVYEWVTVKYNYDDVMGYANYHNMILEKKNSGAVVVADHYDDLLVSYLETENHEIAKQVAIAFDVVGEATGGSGFKQEFVVAAAAATGINSNQILNVGKTIEYADAWVLHAYGNKQSGGAPGKYNSSYGWYSNDCMNYVSQCLRAGGMSFDFGGTTTVNHNNYDGTGQWWSKCPVPNPTGMQSDLTSNIAWRYIPSFKTYWTAQGYTWKSNAAKADIFPGNPISQGTQHIGICVGYDGSGNPIMNSHNRDTYHVPYTWVSTGSVDTLLLNRTSFPEPSLAVSVTPTTSVQALTSLLYAGDDNWHKITITETATYTFESAYYSPHSLDMIGFLYVDKKTVNGTVLYMYEIAMDDDSGDGNNFKIRVQLSPGTYYLRARCYQGLAGRFTFKWLKG